MEEQILKPSVSTTQIIESRTSLVLKAFKDNIPFAIAITTVLGGISQFYNLSSIGKYYVRFFSLTQLISDGIWIIYLLLPFYIITMILIPFIFDANKFVFRMFDPIDKNQKFSRKRAIIVNSILILFVYFTMFYFLLTNQFPYAPMLIVVSSFIGFKINFVLFKKYNAEDIFFCFGAISFVVFFISIYCTALWIFRDNNIPKNLVNNKIVNQIIEEKYPNYKYELLYMNDKYIFSKIYCDSINENEVKVLLIPSEEFLNIDKLD